MTFNEADHPRDRGSFTDKPQSAPEAGLARATGANYPLAPQVFTIICNEHDTHPGVNSPILKQFPTEELAETWIDTNDKSHQYYDCDLWLDYTIVAMPAATS